MVFGAFDDTDLLFDEVIGEGELLAVRYRMPGKHAGDFMGVRATRRDVALEGQTFLRYENGLIVERWHAADLLGLLRQLGAFPPPV